MSSSPESALEARVLEAAAALFDERGGDVRMNQVAERAGVSRGTVYRIFGNRANLFARLAAVHGVAVDPSGPSGPRERILDALSALIADSGLHAATLELVAERAGVAVMTIYRHFGDRAGLLRAFVAERSPRRLAARLDPESQGDLAGELIAFLGRAIAFLAQYPQLVRMEFSPDPAGEALFAEARRGSVSSRRALERYLTRNIERGRLTPPAGEVAGDDGAARARAAKRMVMMLIGAAMSAAHMERERALSDPEEIAHFIVHTCLFGWAGAPTWPGDHRS